MHKTTNNYHQPLVSVIMPAYNASRYLEQAARSVFNQTYSNWELLITDDASLDNTLEIARQLEAADPRVVVLAKDKNSGVADSRNVALERARGKFIAFLDSDDLWLPEKLSKQVAYMESNKVRICYSAYQRIDEASRVIGTVTPPARVDYGLMLKSNFIGNLTGIYNAQALGKQFFPEIGHEDYVAWLMLVKKSGEARSINETLALYRVYGGSISGNKLKAAQWQWKIYRQHLALGPLQSSHLMLSYFRYALGKRAT